MFTVNYCGLQKSGLPIRGQTVQWNGFPFQVSSVRALDSSTAFGRSLVNAVLTVEPKGLLSEQSARQLLTGDIYVRSL